LKSSDVIIIGAGIAGTSLAANLSQHRSVTVLEMEQHPGFHATGRSAAYYAPSYGNSVVQAVTKASGEFFHDPPDGFSAVPLINNRPTMFVATSQQSESFNELLDSNAELELVSGADIKGRVSIIDKGLIVRAALDLVGGDLDVDALMQGLLRQLKQRDGKLVTREQVIKLDYKDSLWQVTTTNEIFQAPIVINAAGAWADEIAVLAGIGKLGLQPKRRTVALVAPPADVDISDWPLVVDVHEQFYFKPDAGQLLTSPADETPSDACDAHPGDYDIALGIDRIQQIASLEVQHINHSWAGLRTFAPDKTFVSGFDPRSKGFYWLVGQGGYGVQSCPAMADIATCLITGHHDLVSARAVNDLAEKLSPARLL
jgi:D-arginine dehydrogenase